MYEDATQQEVSRWESHLRAAQARLHTYLRAATRYDADLVVELMAEVRAHAWIERDMLFRCTSPEALLIQLAREAARQWVALSRYEVALHWDIPDTTGSADDDLAFEPSRHETCEHVRVTSWLGKLSARQRRVLQLRFWRNLSIEAIALELDMKEATVRVHAHRALKRLRQMSTTEMLDRKPLWASEPRQEQTSRG